jgi:hypothetical protein
MPYHNKAKLAISFSNWLLFTFLVCLLFSCRRNKDSGVSSCDGFLISTLNVSGRPEVADEHIYYTDAQHKVRLSGGYLINSHDWPIVSSSYSWRKQALYFTSPADTYLSTGRWSFRYFCVDAGVSVDMGNAVMTNTSKISTFVLSLVCNTSADIVYAMGQSDDSSILYEISRSGVFNVREIFGTDSSIFYYDPSAVDETSGSIFFLKNKVLMKIDPITAKFSTVAMYTDADPVDLLYNDNDKMFYALDNLHKYRLLRIDPANGVLTVIGTVDDADFNRSPVLRLDRCNNQCILV